MKVAIAAVALVGASVTLGFMMHAAESFPSDAFDMALAGWGGVPFLAMAASMLVPPPGRVGKGVLLAGFAAVVVATVAILLDAFGPDPDAQAGLIFLFLPIYQGSAVLIVYAVARWFGRRPQPR